MQTTCFSKHDPKVAKRGVRGKEIIETVPGALEEIHVSQEGQPAVLERSSRPHRLYLKPSSRQLPSLVL